MAAIFEFQRDTDVATGSPSKGTIRTPSVTDTNWKNSDNYGTLYSSAPISAGNNSFEIWNFGKFTGTFNNILGGLFAHTAGTFGTGLTLKGAPACTGDGDRLLYTTPSITSNVNLTTNMTSPVAISTGVSVCFGPTGPEATGKAASMTTNPCYTNYLTTQLETTLLVVAGDTAIVTLTLEYQEN